MLGLVFTELNGLAIMGLVALGAFGLSVTILVGREIYYAANPDRRPTKKGKRGKK